METSSLSLDVYEKIISYVDWLTLQEIKRVNFFCYQISKKELKARLNSKYPFGEKSAKLCVITDDINLSSIFVLIGDRKMNVPLNKYPTCWIRNVIISWFTYSNSRYILTGKLFKSIIRIINKKLNDHSLYTEDFLINENNQTLIFRYLDNGKTYLEEVY